MKKKLRAIATHPVVLVIVRVAVGGMFIAFGVVKAIEPREEFIAAIGDYQMVPEAIIPAFAAIMIYAEIILGALLIVGLFTRWAATGIALMLLMFIIAISQGVFRGLELSDCGCSGSLISLGESPAEVLTRDFVFLAGAMWAWIASYSKRAQRFTLDRLFEKPSI